MNFWHFKIRLF